MHWTQFLKQSLIDDKFRQRSLLLLSKICKTRSIIPAGYVLRGEIRMGPVYYHTFFADVSKGEYSGSPVAIKRLRVYQGGHNNLFKVPSIKSMRTPFSTLTQSLCREAIGWRHLIHPNILPLLGVSEVADYFDILTEWMPHGNLMQYAKLHPEVNRLELVSTTDIFPRPFACSSKPSACRSYVRCCIPPQV